MNKEIKLDFEDYSLYYKDDPSIGEKIFKKILEWCTTNEIYSGEVLCQCDDGTLNSPILVSDILDDIIKFKIEWKE